MATVYLGIGSNLGDRAENVSKAIEQLREKIEIEEVSSFYETEPQGEEEQPWFVNCTVRGETSLSPQELLSFLKGIESSLGRRERKRWGPRIIDLDILLYDELAMDELDLKIPHPLMCERAFVLEPLAEIAPRLRHPTSGKSMKELLNSLSGRKKVKRL